MIFIRNGDAGLISSKFFSEEHFIKRDDTNGGVFFICLSIS